MKIFLFLLLSFSAMADVTLNEAYRREKSFLLAQKEALLKMKSSLNQSLYVRKAKAQSEIQKKQNELSALMLKNNELHEEFKSLEKMTKESSQMAGQLEKNALKIQESLASIKSKMGSTHFRSLEADPVKKFEGILQDSLTVINDLSLNKWKSHAFLDENDHLVQGEVMFQGLFSAWGRLNDKVYSLVPYNNEFLKVAQSFSGKEVYIFSPDFERSGFKAAKTWKESVADAIPGLVMMMIMICVLGLFILLARA
jgi:hypothetical protein